MNKQKTRGIHALYNHDPQQADWLVWGRKVDPLTRRGFLTQGSLWAMTAVLGAHIPFAAHMPAGLIPAALANSEAPFSIAGKEGLIILNDRPINAETPPHLLDDEITPTHRFFVRNNGIPPALETIEPQNWTLEISGESCQTPTVFTLAELKQQFSEYTYQLQLECGGNGRKEFKPPASGNQWSVGAVGCAQWRGVRLKDVLMRCGIKDDAVYIGYYGADTHLSGDPEAKPISRGVPMAKALEEETLIAWAMNDEPLPHLHGYPLRLVCGGWPGSTSGKWLNQIMIRNQIHDGPKMGGDAYRVPCQPVAPGTRLPDEDMCIIESMPVKSIITQPQSGIVHPLAQSLTVRGHAWAGDLAVNTVEVSYDFGATWQAATLKSPVNRLAWQRWHTEIQFPKLGYYEIWARATDSQGRAQPMVLPGWNPKGYLNNACHRIAVQAV
ncbi:MAG: sulfite oxidase [Pseudomonadota bacterium]|nr:sulfite oxidase [Pseudomonadota bacterium]